MSRVVKIAAFFCILFLLDAIPAAAAAAAHKTCCIKVDRLSKNNTSQIQVDGDVQDVTHIEIIHNPNSALEKIKTIAFGSKMEFTPIKTGIVKISALKTLPSTKNNEKNCETICSKMDSVHFSSFPLVGFIIFIFAGTILMGGTIVSIRSALKSEKE